MKLLTQLILCIFAALSKQTNSAFRGHSSSLLPASESVIPCERVAAAMLHQDRPNPVKTPSHLVAQRAADYCAVTLDVDTTYVCPFFADFVRDAYETMDSDRETPGSVCATLLDHATRTVDELATVRQLKEGSPEATRRSDCMSSVTAVLEQQPSISINQVPDFWYQWCLNKDCAHELPSRTKWCDQDHDPVESEATCSLLRSKSQEDMRSSDEHSTYGAEQLCDWVLAFSYEQAGRVEAYEHVVFGKTDVKFIPVQTKAEQALLVSKLQNAAAAHDIRNYGTVAMRAQSEQGSSVAPVIFAALGILLAVFS